MGAPSTQAAPLAAPEGRRHAARQGARHAGVRRVAAVAGRGEVLPMTARPRRSRSPRGGQCAWMGRTVRVLVRR